MADVVAAPQTRVRFGDLLVGGIRNGIYKPKEFHGRGAKIVNMGELFAHPRMWNIEMKRVELTSREMENSTLFPGDLLFARRSLVAEGAGKCSIVCEVGEPTTFESSIIRARIDRSKADPFYLYYLFNSPTGRHLLGSILRQVAVAGITGTDLVGLELPVLPLAEQERVAAVLRALDDKIELNRRVNETLDAMARSVFKSWFVDFEPVRAKAEGRVPARMNAATLALFPNQVVNSNAGEIPRGWVHKPLYDCAQWVNGAAYRDFQFCAAGEGLPIVKIAELKAGISGQTKFTLTNPGDKYLIDTGDILFSWSGNPDTSIDTFVWSRGKAWLNQHIFRVITGSPRERSFVLWLLRHLRPVFAEIARNKQTTGLGHVTAGDMRSLRVAVPGREILSAFDELVGPLNDLMLARDLENATLVRLRQELLPKLLSGELRVRDADRIVERAV